MIASRDSKRSRNPSLRKTGHSRQRSQRLTEPGQPCMAELIHEHPVEIDDDGTTYIARVYAAERDDGTWEGWLEFHPTHRQKPVLRTGQETSQPSRTTIEYWALGVEPVYFDGALVRAKSPLP